MLDDNLDIFKVVVIVLLLLNTGLLVYVTVKQQQNKTSEGWSSGMGWESNSKPIANASATYVTPAAEEDEDYGQKTYAGCSCVGYGAKNNRNMQFNNDSNLYAKTIYQGY